MKPTARFEDAECGWVYAQGAAASSKREAEREATALNGWDDCFTRMNSQSDSSLFPTASSDNSIRRVESAKRLLMKANQSQRCRARGRQRCAATLKCSSSFTVSSAVAAYRALRKTCFHCSTFVYLHTMAASHLLKWNRRDGKRPLNRLPVANG